MSNEKDTIREVVHTSLTEGSSSVLCICECGSLDHVCRFERDPDFCEGICVEVVLSPDQRFWRRIWNALVYLVRGGRPGCGFGVSACCVIRAPEARALLALCAVEAREGAAS